MKKQKLIFFFMMIGAWLTAQEYQKDVGFEMGAGIGQNVRTVSLQPDGRIIIGGDFDVYDITNSRNRIARLHSDGSLDVSFDPGIGFNGPVFSTVLQNDGKIIVGGRFSTYQGESHNGLIRLHTNGSIDRSFNTGTGFSNGPFAVYINQVVLQSDGKILVGGTFTRYNGEECKNLVRINPDGTLDKSFNTPAIFEGEVKTIIVQPDGRILLGGSCYYEVNFIRHSWVIRLHQDGSPDLSYNHGTGPSQVPQTLTLQDDGKILIGGLFGSFNGIAIANMVRVNANGVLDPTFDPGSSFNSRVHTILLRNNKILVGGEFSIFNGVEGIHGIARLNMDGTLDTSFKTGYGFHHSSGIGGVLSMAYQPDNKILAGGTFTHFDNVFTSHFTRISDKTVSVDDNSFKESIQYFPNPTQGHVQINTHTIYEQICIVVRDVWGQEIWREVKNGIGNFEVNVEGVSGLYFIEVSNQAGQTAVFKVIKE
jgi:uncharacterized delta-60 repeat protein